MALSRILQLAILAPLSHAIEPARKPRQPLGGGERLLMFNETSPSPLYAPSSQSVDWISGDTDGNYITFNDNGAMVFESIATGESSIFVPADQVPNDYWEYWISPDQERVLWSVNYTKQYRHSYFADYMILDVASGGTTPLVEDQAGDIQYAEFAPEGGAIAFVRGNNLFIHNNSEVMQITEDGGADMFHGVPDWVYEEEIFGDRYVLWFSPDGQYLAFLSMNETGVGTFTVPYFMNDMTIAPPYPNELELRYPKVGTTNPTVEFNVLNMSTLEYTTIPIDAYRPNNTIIGEVAWVTDGHDAVIARVFNRVQDHDKHVLINPMEGTTEVVRERNGSDGWIDNMLTISYIGEIDSPENNITGNYYVDMSDMSGWMHLYLYPVAGGEPIALTSGEWEVVSILKIDPRRELIYYTSTERHSIDRHIYSVSYTTLEKTPIVDDTIPASWSASFSSGGGYYILTYQGPGVPFQEVFSINSTEAISTLVTNEELYQNISDFNLPNITYFELEHPSGYSFNVMQRLPPNFNYSRQYPVLFVPYGGPGAQEVTRRFQALDWNAYISSDPELQYITYTVDNRGTGYKGRAFRSTVTNHLGRLEPLDQIWAAEQLIEMFPYINPNKVGMWGWSYGGYLTAKTLEQDSDIFSFGLITAPVSDWRFYDSMYTERYMKTYEMNPAGYNETAVRNATGFANARGGFAISKLPPSPAFLSLQVCPR
jgi:dipeptidyl-peptidase 4